MNALTYRLIYRVDAFAHRSLCYRSEKKMNTTNKSKNSIKRKIWAVYINCIHYFEYFP